MEPANPAAARPRDHPLTVDADDLLAAGMTPELAVWVADLMEAEARYRRSECVEAFERGRAVGHDEGRREYEAEEVAAWRVLLGRYKDHMRRPSFAQLEHRRYGAGGRESWVTRRDDCPEERERLASAGLGPGSGRWPKDVSRRAVKAGEEDPLDPAAMLARVRASWAALYPDEFPTEEENPDAQTEPGVRQP